MLNRFERYEAFSKEKDILNLEELVEELRKSCGINGYSFELNWSEVENLYYGQVTDFLMDKIVYEVKRSSSLKSCVISLLYKFKEV